MRSFLTICACVFMAEVVFGAVIRPGAAFGPRSTGMSGAYNAIAADGAAFYHNIAGLSATESGFIEVSSELIFPRFKFEEEESEFSVFPMPNVAGGIRFDRLVLGLGIYTPYGMGVEYEDGPYQKSQLSATNATLGFSYAATDKLTLGAGVDIGFGQLTYNASQVGDAVIPPLLLETQGQGWGIGLRVGALWKVSEQLTLGASYASAMKIKLNGHTEIDLLGIDLGRDSFSTTFSAPARIGLGATFKPRRGDLLFACDVNFYDWKTETLKFDFAVLPRINQSLDWLDTISVHVGAEKKISPRLTARCGIAWLKGSVPKHTVNPIIPVGNDGTSASIGFTYDVSDQWSIDAGYLRAWSKESIEVDIISVGARFSF